MAELDREPDSFTITELRTLGGALLLLRALPPLARPKLMEVVVMLETEREFIALAATMEILSRHESSRRQELLSNSAPLHPVSVRKKEGADGALFP